ncbi:MAG TPA: permease, partial [Afifellaceae bacterium]|nr:permease [Afifellaceae bacterium]
MMRPATLPWFIRHELALAWRDWMSMMTAGKPGRGMIVAVSLIILAGFLHLLAYGLVGEFANVGSNPGKTVLVVVTGCALLSWSLMLSQAMESVTRAFYARADLDLILSSPASSRRVFALRIGAIAISTVLLAVLVTGPVINVLALNGGVRWLSAYGVVIAMGATAAALAVALTVAMFRLIGPQRTRLIAQIVAAIVGAFFVIGVQAAAILMYGSISRITFFNSDFAASIAPETDSMIWLPARAALGDQAALAATVLISLALLFMAIAVFSGRFGEHATAAAGIAEARVRQKRMSGFRTISARRALRHKEWTLLRRDPWLVSQTLMQIFYLLPPALLLWRNFGSDTGTLTILAPVTVMAAGQLSGGLAWLAVSGEDAPDLVRTAPISPRAVIVAKIEAVLGAIAMVMAPLLIAIGFASPRVALVTALGIAASASSATAIQLWFRAQARRNQFRRRQTSS